MCDGDALRIWSIDFFLSRFQTYCVSRFQDVKHSNLKHSPAFASSTTFDIRNRIIDVDRCCEFWFEYHSVRYPWTFINASWCSSIAFLLDSINASQLFDSLILFENTIRFFQCDFFFFTNICVYRRKYCSFPKGTLSFTNSRWCCCHLPSTHVMATFALPPLSSSSTFPVQRHLLLLLLLLVRI